jgi:hypothetical protein
LTLAKDFPNSEQFLHYTEGSAGTGRNYSEARHERRALDLIPLVSREICLRRHNYLLCVSSLLVFQKLLNGCASGTPMCFKP